MQNTTTQKEEQAENLKGICPFCLSETEVYLDVKDRPYWVCLPCGTRTFATKKALVVLKTDGWIWSGEQPTEAIESWLKRVSVRFGLRKD